MAVMRPLNHPADDRYPRRGCEFSQFDQSIFLLHTAFRRRADEHRGFSVSRHSLGAERFLKIRFQFLDKLIERELALVKRRALEYLKELTRLI